MTLQHSRIPCDIYDYEGDFVEMWELKPSKQDNTSYSKDYVLSGQEGKEIPEEIERFVEWVNSLGCGKFDKMTINWHVNGGYCTEEDSDETISKLVSISFGATGLLRIRRKSDDKKRDLELTDGDIVAMSGSFHTHYTYHIPKQSNINDPKISITFIQFGEENTDNRNGSILEETNKDKFEIDNTIVPEGHISSKYSIPEYHPNNIYNLPIGINKTIRWISRDFFDNKIKKSWERQKFYVTVPEWVISKAFKIEWEETEYGYDTCIATSKSTINGIVTYRRGKYIIWEGEEDCKPSSKIDRAYIYSDEGLGIMFLYNGFSRIPKGNIPGYYSDGVFVIL